MRPPIYVHMQVVIGAPFLFSFPNSYLSKAFELSRVFFHQWTVNLKFLPEEIFISKPVALLLLGGHLGFLVVFAALKWSSVSGGLLPVLQSVGLLPQPVPVHKAVTRAQKEKAHLRGSDTGTGSITSRLASAAYTDSPAFIVYVLYTSNFIGIVFSRTMHYQFYTWYFHTIPLVLAAATSIPWFLRLAAFAGIEYAFNVGDATGAGSPLSSAILQMAHLVVFTGLLTSGVPSASVVERTEETSAASKKKR
jgi:alpha-1,3-mannosyltransferase